MPRARNQYIEEMRERYESKLAGRRIDRSFNASNEEKTTLTGAAQVISRHFLYDTISKTVKIFCFIV